MITARRLLGKLRFDKPPRKPFWASPYQLSYERLLEYPGFTNTRAFCHLRGYTAQEKPTICIVGNFDDPLGTSTGLAVEVVATAVADTIHSDDFRLIHWYPHSIARIPFRESPLKPVPPRAIDHDTTIVQHDLEDTPVSVLRRQAAARFAHQQWHPVDAAELADLLGDQALYELCAIAGRKDEYTPQRAFDTEGQQLDEEIRAHNHAQSEAFEAWLRELGIGPEEEN